MNLDVRSTWRWCAQQLEVWRRALQAGQPKGHCRKPLRNAVPTSLLRAWRRGGLDQVWGSSSVTDCRTIPGASAEQGMEEGEEEMGDEGRRQRAGRRRMEGSGCVQEDHSLCAGGLHLDARRPSPVQRWDGHAVSELV